MGEISHALLGRPMGLQVMGALLFEQVVQGQTAVVESPLWKQRWRVSSPDWEEAEGPEEGGSHNF